MVRTANVVTAHATVATSSTALKQNGATRSTLTPLMKTMRASDKSRLVKFSNLNKQLAAMVTKKRRFKSGTVALRDIRKTQRSVELLIRKLPFERLVREIAQEYKCDLNFKPEAFRAIQEGTEAFLIDQLRAGYFLAVVSRKRVTLTPKDMQVVGAITRIVNNGDTQ
jgi:histone H3